MKTINVNSWRETPNNFTGVVEYSDSTKIWYKDGLWHREDGPACEYPDGRNFWFLENKQYKPIKLKDYVVLDYYKGECDLMWYKLLGKDQAFDYPDIPGLITK